MDVKADSSWLMNYQSLRLLRKCRPLIQAEFGERIVLSDPGLWRQIERYARETRSDTLSQCIRELRDLRFSLSAEHAAETQPPAPPTPSGPGTEGAASTKGDTDSRQHIRKRIYRGRVIS